MLGADHLPYRACTKRMMTCGQGLLSKPGSSRPKKENKIAVLNATEKFLRPKKWSQHR